MKILYQWVENLAFYMVLVTAILRILPGKEYEKYVRVFMGMLLILFIMLPIMKLTGIKENFLELYHSKRYEMERKELEEHEEYLKNIDFMEFVPEQYKLEKKEDKKEEINVEEIRVGE